MPLDYEWVRENAAAAHSAYEQLTKIADEQLPALQREIRSIEEAVANAAAVLDAVLATLSPPAAATPAPARRPYIPRRPV